MTLTPEPFVATQNVIVHDPYLDIDRQVIAGQPVPPDLLEVYFEKTGEKPAKAQGEDAREELHGDDDLDDLGIDELQKRADDLGLTVEGTGQNGRVLKKDLVDALGRAAQ